MTNPTATLALTFARWDIAAWAAAIAIPTLLILYFLKLRRRDVEISTTLLWKKAIEDLQANAPFQKLRKNLLLFLQLLALAAALFGIAQPEFSGGSTAGSRHLIVIDASASMNAEDAKNRSGQTVSRLEAAKEQALDLVGSLDEPGWLDKESGDRAMVIAFDRSARALQSFTGDKTLLRRAIESIRPTDAPTSVEEAFQLVQAQAQRKQREEVQPDGSVQTYDMPPDPVGTIHLISDGRLPDADKMTPGPEDGFVYHAVGTPEAMNVGVTSLRADRAFDNPNRLSIFAGLESTDPRPRSVDVELLLDGVVAAAKSVSLPGATSLVPSAPPAPPAAGSGTPAPAPPAPVQPARTPGAGGVVFSLDRPEGAVVTVRVVRRAQVEDVLRTDDTAWLVVPPAKRLAVAVVTRGNMFLSAALEGLPLAKLEQMSPEQFEALLKDGRAAEYDVAILDGWLPPPTPGEGGASLPPGRFLIFGTVPPPPTGPVDTGEGGAAYAIDWKRDHPVLRNLTLDGLFIAKSRLVDVPKGSPASVIAISETGPIILEIASGPARAILATFDPADSAWSLNWGLVVFVGAAVSYLGDDDAGIGQLVRPGDTLSDRLPSDAREVRLRGPFGVPGANDVDAILSPAADGRVVFGPVRRSGVYHVSWLGEAGPRDGRDGDRAVRPFAANLLDEKESDLGTVTRLDLGSREVRAQAQAARATRRLWPWLLLGALAVILFEWFIYNRKVQL